MPDINPPEPAEHTTHYDDCGCLSARYNAELVEVRGRLVDTQTELAEAQATIERQAVNYRSGLQERDTLGAWAQTNINARLAAEAALAEAMQRAQTFQNKPDYWGRWRTAEAALGRVRALLRPHLSDLDGVTAQAVEYELAHALGAGVPDLQANAKPGLDLKLTAAQALDEVERIVKFEAGPGDTYMRADVLSVIGQVRRSLAGVPNHDEPPCTCEQNGRAFCLVHQVNSPRLPSPAVEPPDKAEFHGPGFDETAAGLGVSAAASTDEPRCALCGWNPASGYAHSIDHTYSPVAAVSDPAEPTEQEPHTHACDCDAGNPNSTRAEHLHRSWCASLCPVGAVGTEQGSGNE